MGELKDLIDISKYAGERFDLVQAGGGNSSIKFDSDEMLIKASGYLLSEVNKENGYSRVSTTQIANIVKNLNIKNIINKKEREEITSDLIKNATLDKNNRPSIETLLHSFLLKYTLHTHPLVVNMIVIRENWRKILKEIFKHDDFIMVQYQTPGIELALALDSELKKRNTIPHIIFLQNHGLIITSNSKKDIKKLTEYVLDKIENYLHINMQAYKLTNKITGLLNSVSKNSNISYLSEDHFLYERLHDNKKLFFSQPFCPDSLVYCGVSSLEIKNLKETKALNNYIKKFHRLPKIVIFENKLFCIAENIKKAKEIEEVLKFHIMILTQNKNSENNFLKEEELSYLSNWEAEKYRENI
jgi:rhamnose utilization protein RhaD (predicted bifunctional aldolase and dehydrogenase)